MINNDKLVVNDNFLLNKKEKLLGEVSLKSKPIRISLNLTGRCNAKCIFCNLKVSKYYTEEEMTLETFTLIKPFLNSVKHLVFFSATEPLVAKNFKEIYKSSIGYNAEKYFSTNAIALKDSIAELLVTTSLDYLTISIHGSTRESYKKYLGVDTYDRVIANIKKLNKFKKIHNSSNPKLRLSFCLMKDNVHELVDIIRLASELEFSQGVYIRHLLAYSEEMYSQVPSHHIDYVKKHLDKAKKVASNLEVPLCGDLIDELNDPLIEGIDRPACYEPFERMHIETDGKVRVCPSFSNNEFAGDLKEQNIDDVWNSELFKLYRKNVNTINQPEGCKNCTGPYIRKYLTHRKDVWLQKNLDLFVFNRQSKNE